MSDWQPSLLMHWYDRNPMSKSVSKAYEVGPHSATERTSYTCPEGKVAMVELMQCSNMRIEAAGTLGAVNTYWYFVPVIPPEGGATTDIVLIAEFLDNTVGSKVQQAIATTFMMFVGDQLVGKTVDVGVGGKVLHRLAYKLTEFDIDPGESFVYVKDPTPKPDIQQPLAVKDPPM